MEEKGDHEAQPLNWGIIDNWQGWKNWVRLKVLHTPVDLLRPMSVWAVQLGLSGL